MSACSAGELILARLQVRPHRRLVVVDERADAAGREHAQMRQPVAYQGSFVRLISIVLIRRIVVSTHGLYVFSASSQRAGFTACLRYSRSVARRDETGLYAELLDVRSPRCQLRFRWLLRISIDFLK